MRDNPGGELDPAVDDSKRCKNSLFVLSGIDKRTQETCDRGSESGQGQFL